MKMDIRRYFAPVPKCNNAEVYDMFEEAFLPDLLQEACADLVPPDDDEHDVGNHAEAKSDDVKNHNKLRKQYAKYYLGRQWVKEDLDLPSGKTFNGPTYLAFQHLEGVNRPTKIHHFVDGVVQLTNDNNLDNYVKAAGFSKGESRFGISFSFPHSYYPDGFQPARDGQGVLSCVCTHFIHHEFYILHVPSLLLICTGGDCIDRFLDPKNACNIRCHNCYEPTKNKKNKVDNSVHCNDCRTEIADNEQCALCSGPIGKSRSKNKKLFGFDQSLHGKVLCMSCRSADVVAVRTEEQTCHGCRYERRSGTTDDVFVHPFSVQLSPKKCRVPSCGCTFHVCERHQWRSYCDNHANDKDNRTRRLSRRRTVLSSWQVQGTRR